MLSHDCNMDDHQPATCQMVPAKKNSAPRVQRTIDVATRCSTEYAAANYHPGRMPSNPLLAAEPDDEDNADEDAAARLFVFCWITVRKLFGMSSGVWMRRKSTDWSWRTRTDDRMGNSPPISCFSRGLINGSVLAPMPTELAAGESPRFETPGPMGDIAEGGIGVTPLGSPPSSPPTRRLCS